jgi:hypothetical protein
MVNRWRRGAGARVVLGLATAECGYELWQLAVAVLELRYFRGTRSRTYEGYTHTASLRFP